MRGYDDDPIESDDAWIARNMREAEEASKDAEATVQVEPPCPPDQEVTDPGIKLRPYRDYTMNALEEDMYDVFVAYTRDLRMELVGEAARLDALWEEMLDRHDIGILRRQDGTVARQVAPKGWRLV